MLTLLRRWESFPPRSLQSTFPEINQKLINFYYEDRPRELGLFSLEKRLYVAFKYAEGSHKKDGDNLQGPGVTG